MATGVAASATSGGGGITAAKSVLATVCNDLSIGGEQRDISSRVKIVILLLCSMDGKREPDKAHLDWWRASRQDALRMHKSVGISPCAALL